MASGRRKIGKENIRSLTRTSGGKSYAISLPIGGEIKSAEGGITALVR